MQMIITFTYTFVLTLTVEGLMMHTMGQLYTPQEILLGFVLELQHLIVNSTHPELGQHLQLYFRHLSRSQYGLLKTKYVGTCFKNIYIVTYLMHIDICQDNFFQFDWLWMFINHIGKEPRWGELRYVYFYTCICKYVFTDVTLIRYLRCILWWDSSWAGVSGNQVISIFLRV